MDEATAERWLPVQGYEGLYEVSDLGRVRSLRKQVILKPGTSGTAKKTGYLMVMLCVGGKYKKRYVHHLVAESFIGPRPDSLIIRHLDGNHRNNAAANLTYGTYSENLHDSVAHGTNYWSGREACDNGHGFTPENSYWNGKQRVCRTCRRERVAEWYARNPDAKAAANTRPRKRSAKAA